MTRTVLSGALACAALMCGGIARAEPPATPMAVPTEPAKPELDPERIAVARQIVAIALQPDEFSSVLGVYLEAVTRTTHAQISRQVGYGDPGLVAIVGSFEDKLPNILRDAMTPMLPDLAEVMARAYARAFTNDDLIQILAFGHTPAGAKYLRHSVTLMHDQDMQSFMARFLATARDSQAPLLAEFRRNYSAYLIAHPELAEKIARNDKK